MAEVRPIDANRFEDYLKIAFGKFDLHFLLVGALRSEPTLDYEPVRYGEWIYDFTLAGDKFYRCSVCGRQENIIEKEDINEHCPYCHCGAKMDGGKGNA